MTTHNFSSPEEGANYAASRPPIVDFVAHWDRLRGDRFAPSWDEFDLPELDPALIPYVAVFDVLHNPLRFRIRFWGTAHVRRKGLDKTGELVASPPDLRKGAAIRESIAVIETKKPVYASGHIDLRESTGVMPFLQTVVRLPLSDNGKEVTHIISLAQWEAA